MSNGAGLSLPASIIRWNSGLRSLVVRALAETVDHIIGGILD